MSATDAHPPAPDPREFRRVMGLFATGVAVVTAAVDARVHAMTANAVMSVSLDPLLVCVSVGKGARMNRFLEEAAGFALNILAEDQEALSRYFAGMWQAAEPPPYRLEPWVGGPRLEGCLASVGCARHQVVEAGDHRLFLGRVVALHRSQAPLRPLLFFAGAYHRLREPAHAARDPLEIWDPEAIRIYYGD
ncbi:FMN reductase (NADH) NtaB [bacterium HR32]|nr:FMN reductase (NADH) NtaB [bacterium HR32]